MPRGDYSFSYNYTPSFPQGDYEFGIAWGTVREVRRERVVVELAGSVKRGDGVSFDCERPEDDLQGGRVYQVFQNGRDVTEPVSKGVVELADAWAVGGGVWAFIIWGHVPFPEASSLS